MKFFFLLSFLLLGPSSGANIRGVKLPKAPLEQGHGYDMPLLPVEEFLRDTYYVQKLEEKYNVTPSEFRTLPEHEQRRLQIVCGGGTPAPTSAAPTRVPTPSPTPVPTTGSPTVSSAPSAKPTPMPTNPPTTSAAPSNKPSQSPTPVPSPAPTTAAPTTGAPTAPGGGDTTVIVDCSSGSKDKSKDNGDDTTGDDTTGDDFFNLEDEVDEEEDEEQVPVPLKEKASNLFIGIMRRVYGH